MSKKVHKARPPLRIGEWSEEQGGGSYIDFAEYVDIPGLEKADIRIEFDRKNSHEEVRHLLSQLNDAGFVFVVQR